MKKLTLNRDYLIRHLAVCLLTFGLSCWFGYDAVVAYPATPAAALYEKIECSKPRADFPLEAFKRQKIASQYGFAALCLLASVLIGLDLASVASFRFSFDDASFVWLGKTHPLADIASADRTQWRKKGILRLVLTDGSRIKLDAWHHVGVGDFEKKVK